MQKAQTPRPLPLRCPQPAAGPPQHRAIARGPFGPGLIWFQFNLIKWQTAQESMSPPGGTQETNLSGSLKGP